MFHQAGDYRMRSDSAKAQCSMSWPSRTRTMSIPPTLEALAGGRLAEEISRVRAADRVAVGDPIAVFHPVLGGHLPIPRPAA
jgi:hypothetical protein